MRFVTIRDYAHYADDAECLPFLIQSRLAMRSARFLPAKDELPSMVVKLGYMEPSISG